MKKLMRKDEKMKELTLLEIGMKTGLRISDILNLKWGSIFAMVDKKPYLLKFVKITEKKTGKTKLFQLSENVQKTIFELLGRDNPSMGNYIFISNSNKVASTGKAWTRQYVWQYLNDYAYRAGIRAKIGTHTLRKTFGYHAYKNGADLSLLMRIFNHSSQAVTLRYIGITQEQIDDVYINLDKIL